jgi:hypothetical protein
VKARRLPVTDRIDRHGEAVVLVGREVVRLSPLAVELVDRCSDWTDDSDLTQAALDRFGPPPEGVDPRAATLEALTALRDRGVLELG